MKINNDFEINDPVSGLKIKVVKGKKLDWLHIERVAEPMVNDRDLYFTKSGHFDGTGSSLGATADNT